MLSRIAINPDEDFSLCQWHHPGKGSADQLEYLTNRQRIERYTIAHSESIGDECRDTSTCKPSRTIDHDYAREFTVGEIISRHQTIYLLDQYIEFSLFFWPSETIDNNSIIIKKNYYIWSWERIYEEVHTIFSLLQNHPWYLWGYIQLILSLSWSRRLESSFYFALPRRVRLPAVWFLMGHFSLLGFPNQSLT